MSNLCLADQPCWHVVHTKPRQEFRAAAQLRNQLHTCFLPTVQVEKIRARKLEVCEEPLFSRYLFIRLGEQSSNWAAIRNTRGVSSLLAFGGRYATVADRWIEALQNTPAAVYRTLFAPGEWVSITRGPFAGMDGIYQAPDGDARALILIELMSQPQKLHLALEVLRKAA